MYSVVGCRECGALKVVEGRPETTQCPRCGRRTKFGKLHAFYRSEDADDAREARARLLAERSGHGDAYGDVGSFAQLDSEADAAGLGDDDYLEASGVDADEVAEAAERSQRTGTSLGKKDAVTAALRELDRPTEAEVVDWVSDHGVERAYVERTLAKLARNGNVTENDGRYRLL